MWNLKVKESHPLSPPSTFSVKTTPPLTPKPIIKTSQINNGEKEGGQGKRKDNIVFTVFRRAVNHKNPKVIKKKWSKFI